MQTEECTFNRLAGKRNLYLLSQSVIMDRSVCTSTVVAAWTEDEARLIHPFSDSAKWDDIHKRWTIYGTRVWPGPESVKVKHIGVAKSNDIVGVICVNHIDY